MNMKKAIIFVLGSTILLTTASIGTTFAWYLSASEAEVEQFDLYLKSDDDLKISTTGIKEEFYNELELSFEKDIEEKHDSLFYPVSSMYSSEWIANKAEEPIFKRQYTGMADVNGVPYMANANKNMGYYTHELYLTSDETHYITIDKDLTKVIANTVYNKESAKRNLKKYPYISSEEEMENNLNKIVDSLRISILYYDDENYNYWIIDPNKNGDTIFGGPLCANFTTSILDEKTESGYYNTYFDNSINDYKEICFGEIYNRDKLIYKSTPEQDDSKLIGTPSTFNAIHKKGTYALDWEASLSNMILGEDIAVEPSITLEEASNTVLIPVFAYKNSKIIVSFYLEGWDLDNINETMDAGFMIDLAFMIAPIEPPVEGERE